MCANTGVFERVEEYEEDRARPFSVVSSSRMRDSKHKFKWKTHFKQKETLLFKHCNRCSKRGCGGSTLGDRKG